MYTDNRFKKITAKIHHKYSKTHDNEEEDDLLQPDLLDNPGLVNLLMAQGDKKKVFSDNNHIYFRCDVTMDRVSELCNLIEAYNREQDMFKSESTNAIIISKPIYLHITTMGGDMLAGFLAYDYIKNSKIPIYTVAEGYAVSSGANMFMAGHKRFMTVNSYVLVHQLNITKHGTETFHDMIDNASNIIEFMSKLYSIYLNNIRHHRQNIPDDDILTKEKLENHMLHDIYWNYNTCIRYGIVDAIYTNYTERDKNDVHDIFRSASRQNVSSKTYTLQELAPSNIIIKKIRENIETRKHIDMADMIKDYLTNKHSIDNINGIINTDTLKRTHDEITSYENKTATFKEHINKKRRIGRKAKS